MEEIKTFDLKRPIVDSVKEFFEKMLSMEVELSDVTSPPSLDGERIAVSLSIAGELMGGINIQVSETFAHLMTAAMLGIDADEIESKEEVNDVLLEACSIIGGNLNSNICDAGFSCKISTPYITSGNDFRIETLNMERDENFAFLHGEHAIIVQVCMRYADDEEPGEKRQLTGVDLSQFKRLDIIESTGDSVIEFFDTMLSMEVEILDEITGTDSDEGQISGKVNFAGDVMGSVNIRVSEMFARLISATMLEVDLEEITEEAQIKDVIGEVTNIIGGNLKSAFCDSGLPCEISPPSITSGNDFRIENLNMDKYENFAFHYQGNNIFVEVCVKIEEKSQSRDDMIPDSDEPSGKPSPEEEDPQKMIDDFLAAEGSAEMDESENEAAPDGSSTGSHADYDSETIIDAADSGTKDMNLDLILDLPVEISVELGQTKKKINELLSLSQGSVLEFSNLSGEPVDILVNHTLIARGDVVVDKEKYGIRVLEIASRKDRIESV